MALLNVLQFPDPRLRNVALPVGTVDDEIRTLVDDMFETMHDHHGVGLAAIQVNVKKRVVVMDVSEKKNEPLVFINPEITHEEGKKKGTEGCLSVVSIFDKVERAEFVTIKALDKDGNPFEMEASDLMAVCIQHEIDHLNGKLFIDHLSRIKQNRVRKKLEKLRRETL